MSENLDRLEKAAEEAMELESFFCNGVLYSQEIQTVEGTAIMFNLKTIPGEHGVFVGDVLATQGTRIPPHTHDGKWEVFVVYKGAMTLALHHHGGRDKSLVLTPFIKEDGNPTRYTVEPGVIHSAYFPEETRFIVVTQPAVGEEL